jgi:hypothetical protein
MIRELERTLIGRGFSCFAYFDTHAFHEWMPNFDKANRVAQSARVSMLIGNSRDVWPRFKMIRVDKLGVGFCFVLLYF